MVGPTILTIQRTRRRLMATLFSGAALGTTGFIAAVTVVTLAAEDLAGSARWAGVPAATAVMGSAIGTNLQAWSVARFGRRPGLALGYLAGAGGAVGAVGALMAGSFWLLTAAMLVLGFGQASSQLARYAAADLAEPQRRATAISLVVWAGTIGSVAGPTLLDASSEMALRLGYPELAGGYLVATVAMGAACLLYLLALRPDPARFAHRGEETDVTAGGVGAQLRRPHVQLALTTLVFGQMVMVLIMVGTPIHIRHSGHGLSVVGVVLSAHTFGMFAFSPLTGRLTDRIGRLPMLAAGQACLLAAALLAFAVPPAQTAFLAGALFLLGLGWNMGFVAGSALLTTGVPVEVRPRLQGAVDAAIWTCSAMAAVTSGLLLAAGGYGLLTLLGGSLVAVPVALLVRRRRVPATTAMR